MVSNVPGGGVSSWDDLTDKPFGEEVSWTTYEFVEDNTAPNRTVNDITYLKVAEHPCPEENPTMDGMLSGAIIKWEPTFADQTNELVVESSHITNGSDVMFGDYLLIDSKVLIVYKKGQMGGVTGIYFPYSFSASNSLATFYFRKVLSFAIPSAITKTVDEKYIPDTIARVSDIPASGGTASAVPEEEMLDFLMEMDVVQPISNTNNAVYTDANNKVYVL